MNILIIARGIPDDKDPLMGIFEYDQAKALAAAGHHVVLFGVDLRSIRRIRNYGIHHGKSKGVYWYRIDVPVGAVPMGIFCEIGRRAVSHLYRIVYSGEEKPDIIHAHFLEQGCMAVYLAEKEKIPLVITEHYSTMNAENISPKLKKYAGKSYFAAKKVIAVSGCLACNIEKNIGVRCEVVPNVISHDVFAACKFTENGLLNRRKDVYKGFGFVMTGSLIHRKAPQMLLEVFITLHRKYPDTYLGFIGDGDMAKDLKKQVHQEGLDKVVTFYGVLTRGEIVKVYQKYDCFVLPSRRESFGVVYIEAMAAGLPVIATRCGGPEDFVTEETGYLITVDDKKELVKAMEKMYKERSKFHEKKIYEYVVERFSESAVAACLTDIYKSVRK